MSCRTLYNPRLYRSMYGIITPSYTSQPASQLRNIDNTEHAHTATRKQAGNKPEITLSQSSYQREEKHRLDHDVALNHVQYQTSRVCASSAYPSIHPSISTAHPSGHGYTLLFPSDQTDMHSPPQRGQKFDSFAAPAGNKKEKK